MVYHSTAVVDLVAGPMAAAVDAAVGVGRRTVGVQVERWDCTDCGLLDYMLRIERTDAGVASIAGSFPVVAVEVADSHLMNPRMIAVGTCMLADQAPLLSGNAVLQGVKQQGCMMNGPDRMTRRSQVLRRAEAVRSSYESHLEKLVNLKDPSTCGP